MVVVAGEDAVLAADDGGDEVALFIDIGHALAVDDALCAGAEMGPYDVEDVLQTGHFVLTQGGAGIALDAACTAAGVEVAAEGFGEDLGGEDDIAHLDDRGKIHGRCNGCVFHSIKKPPPRHAHATYHTTGCCPWAVR